MKRPAGEHPAGLNLGMSSSIMRRNLGRAVDERQECRCLPLLLRTRLHVVLERDARVFVPESPTDGMGALARLRSKRGVGLLEEP
jgi:hypothetical protein